MKSPTSRVATSLQHLDLGALAQRLARAASPALFAAAACGGTTVNPQGHASGTGGSVVDASTSAGGTTGSGGSKATGGKTSSGGTTSAGGAVATGGSTSGSGGATSSGGTTATGGAAGTASTGGRGGTGGSNPVLPELPGPDGGYPSCTGTGTPGLSGPCCVSVHCIESPDAGAGCPAGAAVDYHSLGYSGLGSGSCQCGGSIEGPYSTESAQGYSDTHGPCCYTIGVMGCTGRPFVISGKARLAALVRGEGWL
jgi:hypothetical protein